MTHGQAEALLGLVRSILFVLSALLGITAGEFWFG